MIKNFWFKVWDFVQAVRNGHYVGFVVKNFKELYLNEDLKFAEPKLSRAHLFSWREWPKVWKIIGNVTSWSSIKSETVRRTVIGSVTIVVGGPFERELFDVHRPPPGGPLGPSPEKRNVTFFNLGDVVWFYHDGKWSRDLITEFDRLGKGVNLFSQLHFSGTRKTIRHDSPLVWPCDA